MDVTSATRRWDSAIATMAGVAMHGKRGVNTYGVARLTIVLRVTAVIRLATREEMAMVAPRTWPVGERGMAKRSITERLAQLEAQRKSLQMKLGKQERARDTRRKVLLGAFLMHRLEKGQDAFSKEQLPAWLQRELPGFITRDDDAALFADLMGQPAPKEAEKEPAAASIQP